MNAIEISDGQSARRQRRSSRESPDNAKRVHIGQQFTILSTLSVFLCLMSVAHPPKRRFVILISGQGSNMQEIIQHNEAVGSPAEFVLVFSNQNQAPGIDWAKKHGIPTAVLAHQDFKTREAFDEQLAELISCLEPDYVLLAGFMRILTAGFVAKFRDRLVNIHPSLLPAFPGLNTHAKALAAGVAWHGCTVHFVTDQLDHGPIIAQAALKVLANDTPQSLAVRVLALEHQIYPRAVQWLAQGKVRIDSAGLVKVDGVDDRHLWSTL